MPKNQYRGGDCLKRGAWTVCRFKGGFGKKEGGGVFEGERVVDTSMHTMRCMETRSPQSCNRCISTELGTRIPVCFSPILHDSLVSKDFEHVN